MQKCCIVGGGPAGIMLGFLLARAGVDVTVLEKWPDFFRDFRGDTIHPSTMELMAELGLLEEFLKLPHDQAENLAAQIGNNKVIVADFSHLKVHCPFITFIPQWDFLNFIAGHAKKYANFKLLMSTEATGFIEAQGKIIGVHAKTENNEFDILADLVVAADGRHSIVRQRTDLNVQALSAPMDVLWFRLSRQQSDPTQSLGKIDLGKIIIMIKRADYWQCGFLIRKGYFEKIQQAGLESLRANIVEVSPFLVDRVQELQSWDQIKLLSVTVDRLNKWYRPGLLCIGDSAHTMSPIGGVGINLAVQDAVASANILAPALLKGVANESDLAAIQKRRELPTRIIQSIQVLIQNNIIDRILGNSAHLTLPFPLKLLQHFPYLRRIPAYIIGIGFRPERIETPDINK